MKEEITQDWEYEDIIALRLRAKVINHSNLSSHLLFSLTVTVVKLCNFSSPYLVQIG